MSDTATSSPVYDLEKARSNYTPTADFTQAQRNYEYDMEKFLKHSSTSHVNPDPVALGSGLIPRI